MASLQPNPLQGTVVVPSLGNLRLDGPSSSSNRNQVGRSTLTPQRDDSVDKFNPWGRRLDVLRKKYVNQAMNSSNIAAIPMQGPPSHKRFPNSTPTRLSEEIRKIKGSVSSVNTTYTHFDAMMKPTNEPKNNYKMKPVESVMNSPLVLFQYFIMQTLYK